MSEVEPDSEDALAEPEHEDYLRWSCERLIERIDASDGHIESIHKRAIGAAAVPVALAAWAANFLKPLDPWEVGLIIAALTGPAWFWWRVLRVRVSADYRPDQFWDRDVAKCAPVYAYESLVDHHILVASAAQASVSMKGKLLLKLQLCMAVGVTVILDLLIIAGLGNPGFWQSVTVSAIMATLLIGVLVLGRKAQPSSEASSKTAGEAADIDPEALRQVAPPESGREKLTDGREEAARKEAGGEAPETDCED